jgi:hypothetical protein
MKGTERDATTEWVRLRRDAGGSEAQKLAISLIP